MLFGKHYSQDYLYIIYFLKESLIEYLINDVNFHSVKFYNDDTLRIISFTYMDKNSIYFIRVKFINFKFCDVHLD